MQEGGRRILQSRSTRDTYLPPKQTQKHQNLSLTRRDKNLFCRNLTLPYVTNRCSLLNMLGQLVMDYSYSSVMLLILYRWKGQLEVLALLFQDMCLRTLSCSYVLSCCIS